jgi:hypothetical protein
MRMQISKVPTSWAFGAAHQPRPSWRTNHRLRYDSQTAFQVGGPENTIPLSPLEIVQAMLVDSPRTQAELVAMTQLPKSSVVMAVRQGQLRGEIVSRPTGAPKVRAYTLSGRE